MNIRTDHRITYVADASKVKFLEDPTRSDLASAYLDDTLVVSWFPTKAEGEAWLVKASGWLTDPMRTRLLLYAGGPFTSLDEFKAIFLLAIRGKAELYLPPLGG